ncbi:hypothetical protein [Psychrobacter fozii]|uniref:Repeat protein (TIGR01451 family) n=1 Tax=Psychrobacter fozii TaxID=198480 RepID=A0A2V4ULG3_9GAMM|nr:hypothetical protein [Psychrobacter fozii]PYE39759.1 hypothetical protein DFP82_103207 [Psychrobacter fozii]
MNMDFAASLVTTKKIAVQKTSIATAISSIVAGTLLAVSSAHAAPEISINQSASGSTTVVEQYTDGNTATITATPNGITMQDGMPYAVTQVTTTPSYVVRQSVRVSECQSVSNSTNDTTISQASTTVTSVPVTNQGTNAVTKVNVITTPLNNVKQVLPVASATQLPVMNASTAIQVMTSSSTLGQSTLNQSTLNQSAISPTFTDQTAKTVSLETLQLTPSFSKPDVVNAKTKVMKILKNKEGREIAVPANHIAQGDIIEYHTTYTNTTNQLVNGINAMVSLPNGIQLLSLNSLLPTLATTDGNSYQVVQPMSDTAATQVNYSALKWDLVNLDASASQTVVIRAKVQ